MRNQLKEISKIIERDESNNIDIIMNEAEPVVNPGSKNLSKIVRKARSKSLRGRKWPQKSIRSTSKRSKRNLRDLDRLVGKRGSF